MIFSGAPFSDLPFSDLPDTSSNVTLATVAGSLVKTGQVATLSGTASPVPRTPLFVNKGGRGPKHSPIQVFTWSPALTPSKILTTVAGSLVKTGQAANLAVTPRVAPSTHLADRGGRTPKHTVLPAFSQSPAPAIARVFATVAGSLIKTGQIATLAGTAAPVPRAPIFVNRGGWTPKQALIQVFTKGPLPPITRVFATVTGALIKTGQAAVLARAGTFTTVAGSLIKTGQIPTLTFFRSLATVPGSLIKTGQTSSITFTGSFTTVAGSIVKTGQVATRGFGSSLVTVAGSLIKTGQVATVSVLRFAPATSIWERTGRTPKHTVLPSFSWSPPPAGPRVLTTLSGSLIKTGQVSSLSVSGVRTTVPGTLTKLGDIAGLSFTRVLTTAPGSIVKTGQTAVLARAGTFTTVAGSLVKTGQIPTITFFISLTTVPGGLVKTGQVGSVAFTRNLTTVAGSIVKTGQTAVLGLAGMLTTVPGTLVKTGQTASLTIQRILNPIAGILVKTGRVATLSTANNFGGFATPGTLTKSGQIATLRFNRNFAILPGNLRKTGRVATLTVGVPLVGTPDNEFLEILGKRDWIEGINARPWIEYIPQRRWVTQFQEIPTVSIGPKDPTEVVVVGIDFSQELGSETILSKTMAATTEYGTDPTPSAILSGAAGSIGGIVTNGVIGGVVGCAYHIKATITTSGGRTLVGATVLPIVVE